MRADPGVSAARRDRAYYEERRSARAKAVRLRKRLAVVAIVALVLLCLGVGVGFAGSSDRIADGVTVGGIEVGGMTRDEAETALLREAAGKASSPVVFAYNGWRFKVNAAQLGLDTDWNAALDQALDAGDGFLVFRGITRLKLRIAGTEVRPTAAADPAVVSALVSRIAEALDRPARNAAIVLEELEPVVEPAVTGATLDREAAQKLIVSSLAGFDRAGAVVLPVAVDEPTVRAPDLEPLVERVRTALSAPVQLDYRKTHLTIEPEALAGMLVLPEGGSSELSIGGKAAKTYFNGLAKALERKPEDAGFRLTGNGRIRVVPSKAGRKLDLEATRQAVLGAALVSSPVARTAALVVETAQPTVSTKDAKAMGIVGVVGSYTTYYGGDSNRVHNVQLVSNLLDDHLIAPGATFSFNETTGERNADQGFLEAPVIINGELETGIGGGVCQVSTTVFNAAYEAGLPIRERTNHALYISHYPLGRDATVNYPDTDLRFTNDTGHWLWLRTFVDSSSLTINLYGTPLNRRVVSEASPLTVIGPPTKKLVKDPTLYTGERIVEATGEPRRTVSVRRIVYDANGEVLYDATWYSLYRAEPKIVRVGTKPKPVVEEPPPAEEPVDGSSGDGGSAGGGSPGGGSPGGGSAGGGSSEPPPAEEPPPSGGGSAEPPPPP
jgi:vancomycin resistance protein YoaR